MSANLYKIKSEVWLYPGMAGWHLMSVPKKDGEGIKNTSVKSREAGDHCL
jgi:hypothetical protein